MALPHREWNRFIVRTIGRSSTDNAENTAAKWTTEHIEYSMLGLQNSAPDYLSWKTIYKVADPSFELVESLDTVIDYGAWIRVWLSENIAGVVSFTHIGEALWYPLDPNTWDPDDVTGRYYTDELEWGAYPYYMSSPNFDNITMTGATDTPYAGVTWMASFTGGQADGYMSQDDLFRNGLVFYWTNFVNGAVPWNPGENCVGGMELFRLHVNYFNAVVNSISRRSMPAAGGVRVVLNGLGFDMADSELNDVARSSRNTGGKAWAAYVDRIEFIGNQGQGTYTLDEPMGEFVRESDLRIVIPSMPPMPDGTYSIKLIKTTVAEIDPPGEVITYAGDFSCDPAGKIKDGIARYSFFVGEYQDQPKPPMAFFGWDWKLGCVPETDRDNIITEYYAPIDVRSPEIFWEGRILSVSGYTRSIDDFIGMYQISDLNIDLASHDHHFQERIALGHSKNQRVSIHFGWADDPIAWRTQMFRGICDDYDLVGTTFKATLKDISQKYFRKIIPEHIVTLDDWPDALEQHIGRVIPELLGIHSLTIDDNPGAIEAVFVDQDAHLYMAAGGPLTSITEVYSSGVLVNPANYSIEFDLYGRTFIRMAADHGNNKITFNCTGYSFPPWDSANGYVQNPAYIIAYFLAHILFIPIDLIDTDSLDTLADLYDSGGWDEIGRLAVTATTEPISIMQELLFSFGAKMWPDLSGAFKFGRKTLETISVDLDLISQTDLINEPEKQFNLRDAINYIKAQWDYYPAASLYLNALEVGRESSRICYDVNIEDPKAWNYPWINSADFAEVRLDEDLRRLAFGNRLVTFSLPIQFINDIDIFDTFRLQDPYGVSVGGTGELYRYYYVISLSYDLQNMIIGVIGSDLAWLIGQCFIIGDCDQVAHNWSNASEWMRMFGYVGDCTTEFLPGGDPLKKICRCEE